MTDLEGTVAIVTGGSRGIGRGVARVLSERGVRVVITGRRPAELEATAAELGSGQILPVAGDATDPAHIEDAVDRALAWGGAVNFVVNNAGYLPAGETLVDGGPERWLEAVRVNVAGPLQWMGAAWRAWMSEHGGAIVNVASIAADRVAPNTGAYSLSKSALVQATKQLALELAPGVRVNAVSPGFTWSDTTATALERGGESLAAVHPLNRLGQPEDIGRAVAFLLSEDAGWITGETLLVDGGYSLKRP